MAFSSIAIAQFNSGAKEVFRFCIKTYQYEGVINNAGTVRMSKNPEVVIFSGRNVTIVSNSEEGDLNNIHIYAFSNQGEFSCKDGYTPYGASISKSKLGFLSDTDLSFSFEMALKYKYDELTLNCKRTLKIGEDLKEDQKCGVTENQRVNIELAFKDTRCINKEDKDGKINRECHFGDIEIDADLNDEKQNKFKELASEVWDLKDNNKLFDISIEPDLFWEKMGVGILPEDFLYRTTKDRNGSIVYEDASL